MSPVSREGWLIVFGFVAAMIASAVGLLWLGIIGKPLWGLVLFVVVAIIAGTMFVRTANRKGDHQRTVADYRKQRPGG
jgi:membrane protein implicated in regulation of membrane protease activity